MVYSLKIKIMTKLLSICTLFTMFYSYSQVGIGTTTPSNASMLEVSGQTISGDYKGFMPPRVPTNIERDAISPLATDTGLLVFVTDTGCLNIWNGSSWEDIHCTGVTISNPEIWINEFHYDNIDGDVGESVEIAATAGLDLTGYRIVRYNGASGNEYGSNNFSGIITDDTGTGFGFATIDYISNGLQNGGTSPDGFALVDDLGTIIQFLSYEGSFTAIGGVANGITSTDIFLEESNITTSVGQSLQLIGTGNSFSDFTWSVPSTSSSGTLNTGQTIN